MKNITLHTLYLLLSCGRSGHVVVAVLFSTQGRSVCFHVQQRKHGKCLKMCGPVCHHRECFSLSPIVNHFRSAHTYFFFSSRRPRALTLVSLPEMQPCFSLPISPLGFLTLPRRHAPNRIWVRLERPNIRLQYLSHNRLQTANCHSRVFYRRFDEADLRFWPCSHLSSSSALSSGMHDHMTHWGWWEARRRMLFNPFDHEGWREWVCLLCFNPQKRAGGVGVGG